MEKNKKRLCGNPRHQKESASRYGQHRERSEMMIVSLTVQRASFFHTERGYRASSEMVKFFKPDSAKKMQAAVTIATAACCSPQNAVNMDYLSNYASGKSSLLAHLSLSIRRHSQLGRSGACYRVSPLISNPYALLS